MYNKNLALVLMPNVIKVFMGVDEEVNQKIINQFYIEFGIPKDVVIVSDDIHWQYVK